MKKVVLIIFIFAICFGSYAQLPIHDRLKSPDLNARLSSIETSSCTADSSWAYSWNSATSSWDSEHRDFYTYNQHNSLTSWLTQYWNETTDAYENLYLTIWTYDLNNNVTLSRDQEWSSNDNQWITSTLVTNVFDDHNNNILKTVQGMSNGVLANGKKTTRTYNGNNLETSQTVERWKINNNTWVNDERTTNFYATNGDLDNYATQRWDTGTNTWIDYSRSTITYGANDDYDIISQTWNVADNTWTNSSLSSKEIITLANGLASKQTIQIWKASNYTWQNYLSVTYTYDAANNLTEYKSEKWDNVKGLWVGESRSLYQYDIDNNLVLKIGQDWDSQNNSWFYSDKYEYYSNCNITEVFQNERNENIQVSPNPSKGHFNFNGLIGDNTITVYDLQGKQVHQSFTMDKTAAIKLNGEKSGIYFYRAINNKNQIRTGKLIIE